MAGLENDGNDLQNKSWLQHLLKPNDWVNRGEKGKGGADKSRENWRMRRGGNHRKQQQTHRGKNSAWKRSVLFVKIFLSTVRPPLFTQRVALASFARCNLFTTVAVCVYQNNAYWPLYDAAFLPKYSGTFLTKSPFLSKNSQTSKRR